MTWIPTQTNQTKIYFTKFQIIQKDFEHFVFYKSYKNLQKYLSVISIYFYYLLLTIIIKFSKRDSSYINLN